MNNLRRKLPSSRTQYIHRVTHAFDAKRQSDFAICKKLLVFAVSRIRRARLLNDELAEMIWTARRNTIVRMSIDIRYTYKPQRPVRRQVRRDINSFAYSEGLFYIRFRFAIVEFRRLIAVLDMPEYFISDRRHKFQKEELLLWTLYRLAQPGTMELAADDLFGRDNSQLSRMFSIGIRWINQNWGHLLSAANLPYHMNSARRYSEKIRVKVMEKWRERQAIRRPLPLDAILHQDINIPIDGMLVMGFIDCVMLKTERPAAGPIEPGPNAQRQHDAYIMQRSMYSGHKKIHGERFETIENPDGLCGLLSGPWSVRGPDCKVTRYGRINTKLEEAQDGVHPDGRLYSVYGDLAYVRRSCISKKYRPGGTMLEQALNEAMAAMRIAVEWDYAATYQTWPLTQTWKKLHIYGSGSETSLMVYKAATILRNAHACLRHSETSSYFDCEPPQLERYFTQLENVV